MSDDNVDCTVDGCTFEEEVHFEFYEGQKWNISNCTFNSSVTVTLITSARSLEETRTRLREIESDLAGT